MTALAVTCAVLITGCGMGAQSPSPLQRYDGLRRQLQWLTRGSGRLAHDTENLARPMARGQVRMVRRVAAILKRDALPFHTRAGATGNVVRGLAGQERSDTVRTYLQLITRALTWLWVEGVALGHVADLAWEDPLLQVGGDEARFARDVAWARGAAARAQALTSGAAKLRRSRSRDFRYTPIGKGSAAR